MPSDTHGPSEPGRIPSLVLVAGASCVGKTTFLRALESGAGAPPLPAEIAPAGIAPLFCTAMDLDADRSDGAAGRTVFLHYDLFRPVTFHGGADFADDPALAVLDRADRLSVVTLWEPPEVLRARAIARRRRLLAKKLGRRPLLRRLPGNLADWRAARARRALMQPWFDDPRALWRLYRGWFRFCAEAGVDDHWLVRPSSEAPPRRLGAEVPQAPPWGDPATS